MASSAMIQLAFLGFLVVSTAFADVKPANKEEKKRDTLFNPSFSFGAKTFGSSAPFAFGSSYSTTAAPFKSVSYSSTPAPFVFGNSFASNAYSNAAAAQSFDGASFIGSSTPAPLFDGSFGSSTPATLIGSSTPAPFLSGAAVSSAALSDSSFSYSSTPASVLLAGASPVVSSTPEPVVLNRSPAFATSYGSYYSAYAPSYAQGAIV
ncbi:BCL-6 corepressor-like protein 1, partial [Aphis craccivora]